MRFSFLIVLLSQVICSIDNTSAGVLEHDWQTPGDGLLTYDDINNRQWLDLSLTILDQFPGGTAEDRYQYIVTQTALGGLFEGFHVANMLEVIELAESAGIDHPSLVFSTNHIATNTLIDLLGVTNFLSAGRIQANGLIDEFTIESIPKRLISVLDLDPPGAISNGIAGLAFGAGTDSPLLSTTGVMLYREAIPEPSTALLASLLLGLLIARSKPQPKALRARLCQKTRVARLSESFSC